MNGHGYVWQTRAGQHTGTCCGNTIAVPKMSFKNTATLSRVR